MVDGVSNYYLGSHIVTGVPHYARIRGVNIKPGIDVVYYGKGSELEYDFVVRPFADASGLRLRFDGTLTPKLTADGHLLLSAGDKDLSKRPIKHLLPGRHI